MKVLRDKLDISQYCIDYLSQCVLPLTINFIISESVNKHVYLLHRNDDTYYGHKTLEYVNIG